MVSEEIDDMIDSILEFSTEAGYACAVGDQEGMYYHLSGMKVALDSLFMQRRVAAHHAGKRESPNSPNSPLQE